MAGIGFSSALSATRNFQTSWLVSETHSRRTLPGKLNHRKNLNVKAEVNYVDAEEAKKLIAVEEYAILDVRDKSQYDRAHIKSCRHVPLFIENKDGDFGTIIKRTLHNNFSGLFFGLPFTKPNPDFVQSIKSQFSPESKLLLVCQEGLRSVAAANKLEHAGFQNIACITSGLQSAKSGCRQSWIDHYSRKDFGRARNSPYLCISIHHILPGASRETIPNCTSDLVGLIRPKRVLQSLLYF
ncbi:hypothetical protein I3760_09G031800 [Carya illinoinensis]|uniref:Rhodanese domain-containing protein n=1 Tax=Carya illinoinensis TaxID=32201 RepID=A0A922E1I4_CARIL|nr:hypothetical protein I3760_09G031800 [Carya illinoinensis]KAG6694080.1 hypothetical protein I3842_09G032300 [Carya illinoinensis]